MMTTLDEWAQPVVDPEVRAYVGSLVSAVRRLAIAIEMEELGSLRRQFSWVEAVQRRAVAMYWEMTRWHV